MKTISIKGEVADGKLYVRSAGDNTIHVFTDPEVKGRESIIFKDKRTGVSLKIRRKKETRIYSTAKLHWVEVPPEKQRWEYIVDSYHFTDLSGANIKTAEKLCKLLLPAISPLFDDDALLHAERQAKVERLLESARRDVKAETESLARSKRLIAMLEAAIRKKTSAALGKALDDQRLRNY